MAELVFHKCRLCGCLFYKFRRETYCTQCTKCIKSPTNLRMMHLNDIYFDAKRAHWRELWKNRMSNPAFREKERVRSRMRYLANKKYAKDNND